MAKMSVGLAVWILSLLFSVSVADLTQMLLGEFEQQFHGLLMWKYVIPF